MRRFNDVLARERRVTRHGDPDRRRQRLRRARRHRREPMIHPAPVTLEGHGIRLEPLTDGHHDALARRRGRRRAVGALVHVGARAGCDAARTSPTALEGQQRRPHAAVGRARAGERRDRRHHALPRHRRRDRPRRDRLHLVRARAGSARTSTRPASCCCSQHAFDTLGCKVVGLRTDNFNFRSQRAIEGLGAKKDGVLRHHAARRDGTVRDTVMYSILAEEWPDVKRHLELRLQRRLR